MGYKCYCAKSENKKSSIKVFSDEASNIVISIIEKLENVLIRE